MVRMAKTRGALPVRGTIQPATEQGFARLIEAANKAYDSGLLLISTLQLTTDEGQKIAGVFVRMPEGPRANLIGD